MGYEYEYNGPSSRGIPNGYDPYQGYDDFDGYDDADSGTHPAVKWGLTFGIVMTATSLAPFILLFVRFPLYASNPLFGLLTVLQNPDGAAVLPFMALVVVSGLTALVSLFLAGFLTTRETGTLRSGTFSGVLATLASNAVSTLVILTWVWLQHRPPTGQTSMVGSVFAGIGGLTDFCCGLVGAIVPAAAIAVLGAGLARLIWGPPEG